MKSARTHATEKLFRSLTQLFGDQKSARLVDEFPDGRRPSRKSITKIAGLKFYVLMEAIGELGDGRKKKGDGFNLLLQPVSRALDDLAVVVPECAGRGIELPASLRTNPIKGKPHVLRIKQVPTDKAWALQLWTEPVEVPPAGIAEDAKASRATH